RPGAIPGLDGSKHGDRASFGLRSKRPVVSLRENPCGPLLVEVAERSKQALAFVVEGIGGALQRRGSAPAERMEDAGGGDEGQAHGNHEQDQDHSGSSSGAASARSSKRRSLADSGSVE